MASKQLNTLPDARPLGGPLSGIGPDLQVRVTAGCWGGSHWPAVVLQVSTECPAQPTAAPADWRRHRAPCRSGRVQGSWPWLLGCWFWSIKCTEGPARVSCDPQVAPGGSCNRDSTRSVRGVARPLVRGCSRRRAAYEVARGAPRGCAGRGYAGMRPAAPEVFPGVPRAAPGACPGAAKADVGDFGTSH